MKVTEQGFLLGTIFAHLVMFVDVGRERQSWNHAEFIFAFAVCFLIFVQFVIRYLAITHVYKTENSIASWVVSILIILVSLALIRSTSYTPIFFLLFGILLLLASAKTQQTRRSVLSAPIRYVERVVRLQDLMIVESAFGVLMILFFLFEILGPKRWVFFAADSASFYGTFFAMYYTLVSTIIMVLRLRATIAEAIIKSP